MAYYYSPEKEKIRKRFRKFLLLAAIALAAAILLAAGISVYLEVIQLDEIGGFSGIYIKNLTYKIIFSFLSFCIIFAAFFLTGVSAKRNMSGYIREKQPAVNAANNEGRIRRFPCMGVSLVVSLLGALMTWNLFYQKALSFFNASFFGKYDPIFGKDIGYYIFQRPFLLMTEILSITP